MNVLTQLHGQTAVIVCHDVMFGPPHELRDFLLRHKIAHLVFIGHRNRALPENDIYRSYCDIYKNGKKIQTAYAPDISRYPDFIAYIIDCFWTLYWATKYSGSTDYYIGLGNMNAMMGLVLRFFGNAKKVIYYVIDYIPNRFSNSLINWFYMKSDSWSALHSDATWNYAPVMITSREKMWDRTFPHQIVVPNGIRIRASENIKKDTHQRDLMYIGTLHRQQGIQLVLEALPIIKEKIQDIRFVLIGQGPYRKDLEALVRKNNLKKQVQFLGYIKDPDTADEKLARGHIGVATYTPDNEMVRNTEPGKVKRYFACGLPVVMTDMGDISILSLKAGCGITVPYDSIKFAHEVIRLLSDKKLYKDMQKKALAFAKRYDWERIFNRSFQLLKNSI